MKCWSSNPSNMAVKRDAQKAARPLPLRYTPSGKKKVRNYNDHSVFRGRFFITQPYTIYFHFPANLFYVGDNISDQVPGFFSGQKSAIAVASVLGLARA